jgi:hypothetical protein
MAHNNFPVLATPDSADLSKAAFFARVHAAALVAADPTQDYPLAFAAATLDSFALGQRFHVSIPCLACLDARSRATHADVPSTAPLGSAGHEKTVTGMESS